MRPVVPDIVRAGAADDMRQRLRIAPEGVDEGFEVLVGEDRGGWLVVRVLCVS